MKTETKKIENSSVELTVTLEAAETQAIIKDVEKNFMREAVLPGFRKGKVPLDLIRRQFADGLKEETLRAMVEKNAKSAIDAEKIDQVAIGGVTEAKCEPEGGSFTLIVEVKPTFKLPTYKGLKISSKDATVKDEAVNEQVGRLRAAYAKYEDAKEGEAAQDGDYVQIDYAGTIKGKPILEINPEAKFVANGTGFWTQLEEGRFVPEILDAIKGMKAGETKENIKTKFDKESAPEGLKGEKAVYTVTLKSFRRRILPTDAELVEKAKAESLEKLIGGIREQMQKSATANEEARREQEMIELLLKKADFELPPSQVQAATENYLKELAERAQYSGIDASYFEKNREKILKDAKDAAEKQVRLWYIIEAIAKEEKIEAKPEEVGKKVVEFIFANAKK